MTVTATPEKKPNLPPSQSVYHGVGRGRRDRKSEHVRGVRIINRKKEILPLFLLCSIIFLCGCEPKITEGEVIGKEFTPSHTQVMFIPVTHSNGKTSYTTLLPYVYYYSDKWTITIRSYSDDGEELRETFRVTQDVYNDVQVGDEFVYDKNMEPNTPEYRRERQ